MSVLRDGSRILLIGMAGQVGSELLRLLKDRYEVQAPSRHEADLTDVTQMKSVYFERFAPDLVINAAAFHDVIECETQAEKAFRINVVAQRDLIQLCKIVDAKYLTFSTDYVFDGLKSKAYLESDTPQPLQIYGISRLAGERIIHALGQERSYVIRTCAVFGFGSIKTKGLNFIEKRLLDFAKAPTLEMASEQIVSPTYSRHLAAAVIQLLNHPGAQPGIFHLVNEGATSWYEFAQVIAELSGSSCQILPVNRGGITGEMRRPLYSALANEKAKALGITLPPLKTAISEYLQARNEIMNARRKD